MTLLLLFSVLTGFGTTVQLVLRYIVHWQLDLVLLHFEGHLFKRNFFINNHFNWFSWVDAMTVIMVIVDIISQTEHNFFQIISTCYLAVPLLMSSTLNETWQLMKDVKGLGYPPLCENSEIRCGIKGLDTFGALVWCLHHNVKRAWRSWLGRLGVWVSWVI